MLDTKQEGERIKKLAREKAAQAAKLADIAANQLSFNEVQDPFKKGLIKSRAESHDLMDAVIKARIRGFLRHKHPELRLSPKLVAERFVEHAFREIIRENVFIPEEALMFVELFLGGVGTDARTEFAAGLIDAADEQKETLLPAAIFKHLMLKCFLQFTPDQQHTMLAWAREEDVLRRKQDQKNQGVLVATRDYENEKSLKRAINRTQDA